MASSTVTGFDFTKTLDPVLVYCSRKKTRTFYKVESPLEIGATGRLLNFF
jgi:hypothetical protein